MSNTLITDEINPDWCLGRLEGFGVRQTVDPSNETAWEIYETTANEGFSRGAGTLGNTCSKVYRRHLRSCIWRGKSIDIVNRCNCPVWMDGKDASGKRLRLSLKTRDLEAGVLLAGDDRIGKLAEVDEFTVAKAVIAVCENTEATATVYLIGGICSVKIGLTVDVKQRLENLQTAHPAPLFKRRLLRGGRKLEKSLHSIFGDYCRHNEWFRYNATIQAFVKRTRGWDVGRP